jgi:hypothetical protein
MALTLPPLTSAEKATCKELVADAQAFIKNEVQTLDADAVAKLGFWGAFVSAPLAALAAAIDAKVDYYAGVADAAIDAAPNAS